MQLKCKILDVLTFYIPNYGKNSINKAEEMQMKQISSYLKYFCFAKTIMLLEQNKVQHLQLILKCITIVTVY